MSKEKRIKSFKDLESIKDSFPKDSSTDKMNKSEYQEYWKDNKYQFRKMIAEKNKKWLKKNSDNTDFTYFKSFPNHYDNIKRLFENEKSRKFTIHVITNFLPLNESKQVPKLPANKNKCDITNLPLTDLDSIVTGKNDARNKHIAYTGKETSVILSGIAIQELERFVMDNVKDFDSRNGQIINHALDMVRKNQ